MVYFYVVTLVLSAIFSHFQPGITHKLLGLGRRAGGDDHGKARAQACSEKSSNPSE